MLRNHSEFWIPAFAGMTDRTLFRQPRRGGGRPKGGWRVEAAGTTDPCAPSTFPPPGPPAASRPPPRRGAAIPGDPINHEAEAGVQSASKIRAFLDSRLRGNDEPNPLSTPSSATGPQGVMPSYAPSTSSGGLRHRPAAAGTGRPPAESSLGPIGASRGHDLVSGGMPSTGPRARSFDRRQPSRRAEPPI